jgi:hypothetical protein
VNPGGRVFDARDAALVQRVTRRFDRARAATLVAHRREQLGELDRPGRGHRRFARGAPVVNFNRADQPAAHADPRQQVADQVGRGRLAVGPGDAKHFHFRRRPAVVEMREHRCRTDVGNHDLRQWQVRRLRLRDHRDRAALMRVGDEPDAVGLRPRPSDEQIPRLRQP